jgi:U3 small nucleolar RNA-associated protein 5
LSHTLQMPDLVTRLSGLHAVLTSRLALHDSLMSLNGKLEMVLAQIEMRSTSDAVSVHSLKAKPSQADKKAPFRYVEGESDEEDADVDMAIDVELSGEDNEGSIEDIEVGHSDSDLGQEDDEDEDEDEDAEVNGFIDDEAEEWSDEDEDQEDDESE